MTAASAVRSPMVGRRASSAAAIFPNKLSSRTTLTPVGQHQRRVAIVRVRAEAQAPEKTDEKATARQSGLAFMLDDGTRKSHSMAENSAFVSGFFRGIASKDQFAQMVASLYFVYSAMEEAFSDTTNPRVQALDMTCLRRLPSLERDMEYFYGKDWQQKVSPTAATQKYVARIEQIAREDSDLLIAHQYTRYLGDLFGGQMMSGMATRSLGLEQGKGVEFYNFQDIPSVKDFIEEWYTALNALDISDAKKEAVVDEANNVFSLNILILEELDGNALLVVMKLAFESLKERIGLS